MDNPTLSWSQIVGRQQMRVDKNGRMNQCNLFVQLIDEEVDSEGVPERSSVAWLVLRGGALAWAQTVPDSVMQVLSTSHDSAGNVVAKVRNTGTKTITAWELKLAGWSIASASWTETRLSPGEIKDGPNSWTRQGDDGTIPEIVAVVFEDGTSISNSRAVDDIFDRRQGVADEFALWNSKPPDWTRERFAEEFGRGAREIQAGFVPRSAYEVGMSIAVSQIRGALEQPGTLTIAELRQFLSGRTKAAQQASRRQK
jgi:hypothetical protein